MYKTVIGLEIHTELTTRSKIFSDAKNEYSLEENVHVAPLDLAFPGTLPRLNIEVVKKSLKLAKIFNMEISKRVIFDRKNYYYPDLPKGYQITQETLPIGRNGEYILLNNKKIRINNIHIEEDTASLEHFDNYTLIDYNRSGVPLIEIVTEPDFESIEEVVSFLEDLRLILKNSSLSNADATKGELRCDVNVNLKNEADEYVTGRVEIKNINTFNNVKLAIEAEVKRQLEALENSEAVELQTRRYDEETNTTILMRSKEEREDYRYFVEPNIPTFKLDDSFIEECTKDIPMLPNDILRKFTETYELDIVSSRKLIKDINLCIFLDQAIELGATPKEITNLLVGPISEYLNKKSIKIKDYYLEPKDLVKIIKLIENGSISSKQAKEIILNIDQEQISVEEFIKKHKLEQISDLAVLTKIIDKVLDDNIDKIGLYRDGKTNAFEYLMGVVMKETSGKCNPLVTRKLMVELIGRR